MKVGLVLALLLSGGVAGCLVGGGGGGNPNLLAPKLVVQPRLDGNVTVFVHGAFREQTYDRLAVAVDNETLSDRTDVFSAEERVPRSGFFLVVSAHAGDQLYESRARIDVDAADERVRVSVLDGRDWSEPRSYGWPYEHILDRPEAT